MPARRKVGVDPILFRGTAFLLQPGEQPLPDFTGHQLRERLPSPQLERRPQPIRAFDRIDRPPCLLGQLPETNDIHRLRIDLDGVPAGSPPDAEAGFAQPRDVDLDGPARIGRRVVRPEQVDEFAHADQFVCLEQQSCEQQAFLAADGTHLGVAVQDLEGPQQTEFHSQHDSARPG